VSHLRGHVWCPGPRRPSGDRPRLTLAVTAAAGMAVRYGELPAAAVAAVSALGSAALGIRPCGGHEAREPGAGSPKTRLRAMSGIGAGSPLRMASRRESLPDR
jgi:hypothetical protein